MTIKTILPINIEKIYKPYFNISMTYSRGVNNNITGKSRRELTVKVVARFGITSPIIIQWFYDISKYQALEHLNKLVKENLLLMVTTHRSPDNRVYVLKYDGAKYAEELLGFQIYYRSTTNPAQQFNSNTVMHDLINSYICLRGIQNKLPDGTISPMWGGFITEPEFKRVFKSNTVRNVDGVIKEPDGTLAAVEIEHSYKNKESRKAILLKILVSLKAGYYSKVFIFSQSIEIIDDIKRFHDQLFEELLNRFDKTSRQTILTENDVALLRKSIIYRTKFCSEIEEIFYR
jgi:hypothetical protein